MRSGFLIALLITLTTAAVYWYVEAAYWCNVPLSYQIGAIDERFDISEADVLMAMTAAETVWESSLGHDLFYYDQAAALTINFIFDERQQLQKEEEAERVRLDEKAAQTEDLNASYAELASRYEFLAAQFRQDEADYEARLNTYNTTVASYNDAGGAPPEVYEELEAERRVLDQERRRLNTAAAELNRLVTQLNELGEAGNQLVETYNENVARYNRRFGEAQEFTQGDFQYNYQGREINVYTYASEEELVLVLAHELGHALSLGHVDNPASLMHYLIGGQSQPLTLTAEDEAEFNRVCGPRETLGTWYQPIVRAWREWSILISSA